MGMGLVANVDDPGTPPGGLVLPAFDDPEEAAVPEPAAAEPAPPEPERIKLFELNGRVYSIPKRPGPNVSVRYLRDTRRHGREHAIAGLMEAMLGAEGMDALADYDDLTEAELDAVMRAVEQHVLGPLKGGGKSGKR